MRRPAATAGLPPLLAVDVRSVSIAEGVRAALAIAAVVALGQWVRWPGLMEAALGALLTCLCDAGGPLRRRLPALLGFGLIGAACTACFGLLLAWPGWVVVAVAACCVFLTSFARIFGQSAMQVGNLLTVVLVLSLRTRLPGLHAAATLAGMFLAGSLWALLLTLAIWRLHPYRPARRAVGDAYRALAELAGDQLQVLRRAGPDGAEWDRHARLHRRQVREAIERAREAVLQTVRIRGPVAGHAAQSWIRLETADQMFAALIALSELLASDPDPGAAMRAEKVLRLLRPVLLLLQRAVAADIQSSRPGLDRAIAAIRAVGRPARGSAQDALTGIAETLAERLRVAATLSGSEAFLPRGSPAAPRRWWAAIQANLHWRSEALRHALRAGALAGVAVAVTRQWPAPYAYWFTITLVLTMQPYFALTFTRAVERVGGTVLGGLFAAALATVATTPLAIAVALFPLATLALSVRAVSFALYIACLTPMVVLLSELGRPGTSEVAIALARAGYTMAGGVLALAGAWALWPSWEPARVGAQLRDAVAAHARYAAAEIEVLLGDAPGEAAERARRAAGVASNALEASLQRALLEPRRGSAARLEAALTVDAALRRVAGRLSALHLTARPAGRRDPAAWRGWAAYFAAIEARTARDPTGLPPRPALPEADAGADALGRLAAQFELIAGAARRLEQAG